MPMHFYVSLEYTLTEYLLLKDSGEEFQEYK